MTAKLKRIFFKNDTPFPREKPLPKRLFLAAQQLLHIAHCCLLVTANR